MDIILGTTPKRAYSWGIGYGTATGHDKVHLLYSKNLFKYYSKSLGREGRET